MMIFTTVDYRVMSLLTFLRSMNAEPAWKDIDLSLYLTKSLSRLRRSIESVFAVYSQSSRLLSDIL